MSVRKSSLLVCVIMSLFVSISRGALHNVDPNYLHFLKFYDIRYAAEQENPPLPADKAAFTIGQEYGSLDQYSYVDFLSIRPKEYNVTKEYLNDHIVTLNSNEIDILFGDEQRIPMYKFQYEEIKKIYRNDNNGAEPNFTYGVELDPNGIVVFDASGNAIPDSNDIDYQHGNTVIYPTLYSSSFSTGFFFNLSNSTVRKYAKEYALKRASLSDSNRLFTDCLYVSPTLVYEDGNSANGLLQYISDGNDLEQINYHSGNLISIYKSIKNVENPPDIIANGLTYYNVDNPTDWNRYIRQLYEKVKEPNNFSCVDGLMIEGHYYHNDSSISTKINFFRNWVEACEENGKKLLFVYAPPVSDPSEIDDIPYYDNPRVLDVWLWYHLIAEDNVYVFMDDDRNYQTAMVDFAVYNHPLGTPLEDPYKDGNIWRRQYQRGVIEYNIVNEDLRDIRIYENDIQNTINDANDFDVVIVQSGMYVENINFNGKKIILRSTEPNNWETVARTVINADDSNSTVIAFNSGEDVDSAVQGFTITGGGRGIYCDNASPVISNCLIKKNGNLFQLSAHWEMDDNDATTKIVDSSGNKNDGTSRQYTNVLHSTGKIDGALDFNGSSDCIRVPHSSSLDFSGSDFSISVWIKTDSNSANQTIISKGDPYATAGQGWLLYYGAAETGKPFKFFIRSDETHYQYTVSQGAGDLTDGWHHVAVTADRDDVATFYLDGAVLGTADIATVDGGELGTGDVIIGRYGETALYHFDGLIDNVILSNKVLSPEEIMVLSNSRNGLPDGGGIYLNTSSPVIENCILSKNHANDGGGLYSCNSSPTLNSCRFTENNADNGGAIYDNNSDITLINCTVIDNSVNNMGGGIYNYLSSPGIKNCIIRNNSSDEIYNEDTYSCPDISYSNIKSSNGSGDNWYSSFGDDEGGNIDSDPCFIDEQAVALWMFDDELGTNTVADSLGDNDGTLHADAKIIKNRYNGVLLLDGTSDDVNISHSESLDFSGSDFSISVWIKTDSNSANQTIISKGDPYATAGQGWLLYYGAAETGKPFKFFIRSDETHYEYTVSQDAGDLTDGWHHVAVTADRDDVATFYLDGMFLGTDDIFSVNGGDLGEGSIAIGEYGYSGLKYFDGMIDNIALYDYVLSPQQVSAIYNSHKPSLESYHKYHLSPDSICVGRGDPNASYYGQIDIDGEMRLMGGRIEIGADEIEDTAIRNLTTDYLYPSIQTAIDDANDFDEIVVYPGTYYEEIDFLGKSITLRSTDPNDWDIVEATIIDANSLYDHAVSFDSSEDANSILSGLTITGGNANGGADLDKKGAGIFCYSQSGTVSPTIRNCIIRDNQAQYGAGIYNYNSAAFIDRCIFTGNSTTSSGGAVQNTDSSVEIVNSVFFDNDAKWGGAMHNDTSDTIITNCTFTGNEAKNYSGGGEGGAMRNYDYSDPIITNCIFWNNSAETAEPEISNSTNSDPAITYSDIEEGYTGTGNINSDPNFADNFYLTAGSLCIDAGDPNGVYTGQTDIDGDNRVIGNEVDMGADEY